jgi:hypothetical protein
MFQYYDCFKEIQAQKIMLCDICCEISIMSDFMSVTNRHQE